MERYHSLTVEDYSTPLPFTVTEDCQLEKVEQIMSEQGFRHIPVVSNQKPVGIISDRDIANYYRSGNDIESTAGTIMSKSLFMVSGKSQLDKVAFEMSSKKIGSAVVTDEEGLLMGIFTTTDALNALIEVLRGETD